MKIRLKRVSTSFTIILILVTLIIGGYLFKILTYTKPQKTTYSAVIVNHPHKKHKKKHKPKSYIAPVSPIYIPDTLHKVVVIPRVKVIVIKPLITNPLPVKPLADSVKISKPVQNYLYTTYVQPNVTGIVKLRGQDKYYANIIADIPANSKVLVLQRGNIYYRVNYNNLIGFIPKWALHIK